MTLVLAVVASTVGMWLTWRFARALYEWRRLRGLRVVSCPGNGEAAVRIDVRHAALCALASGNPDYRLASCSRWPARAGCGQRCLADAMVEENTTRRIAERGFKGKTCIYCGKPIGDPHFLDHYAALLGPEGITVQWPDIRPEDLRDRLEADFPVCWNCHIAESFRRRHPELVTDRPWPR